MSERNHPSRFLHDDDRIIVMKQGRIAGELPRAQAAPDPATQDYRLQARALAPGVWVVEGANDDFSVANGCNIINTGFIATGAGAPTVERAAPIRSAQTLITSTVRSRILSGSGMIASWLLSMPLAASASTRRTSLSVMRDSRNMRNGS